MSDSVLLTHLKAATMVDTASGYGLIKDAGIALEQGQIRWVGQIHDCPAEIAKLPTHDCGGRLVTPALIDCHTHIVHGGNRAQEFEMRLEGASYEEVARAGGGIVSTVKATRETSEEDLLEATLRRADALISEGVATI